MLEKISRLCVTGATTALFLAMAAPAGATNLIVNGDFNAGFSGFSSQYIYSPDGDWTGIYPGAYFTIANNRFPWNEVPGAGGSQAGFGPRTGTLMLIADGAMTSNTYIWQETVSVTPNSSYAFGGWSASWGHVPDTNYDESPAHLVLTVNGVQIGSLQVPSLNADWQELSGNWNSGAATSATITIVDTNTAYLGNDFTLDDLVFACSPGPIPGEGLLGLAFLSIAAAINKARDIAAFGRRFAAVA